MNTLSLLCRKSLVFFLLLIFQIANAAEFSGQFLSQTLIKSYSKESLHAFFESRKIPRLFLPVNAGVDVYEVIYSTTYADGAIVKASGLLFAPKDNKPNHPTLLYNHGTEICHESYFDGKGEQSICLAFATDGYIVLCPDYVGIGKGERIHLYMHAETEANATIDMLRASESFLTELGVKRNEKLFLSGYSQGGHASLATHKMIQEKYQGQYEVTASSPMSGPYDLEQTVYNGRNKKYSYPGYLMMLFQAYYGSKGDYREMAQALCAPYNKTVPPLMDGFFPVEVVNEVLPDTAFRAVKPEIFRDFEENEGSEFRQYLSANSVHNWKPESPVQLCFCNGDREVSYKNSETTYQNMVKNGSREVILKRVGKKFDHVSCAQFAVIYTKMFFDEFVNEKGKRKHYFFKKAVLNIGKLATKK